MITIAATAYPGLIWNISSRHMTAPTRLRYHLVLNDGR